MKILLIEEDNFFKSFTPDLALLDLITPKLDGFAVLTARSQDENLKKIPVIVFSTLGQEKDIETAQKLGANGYMNKGFFDFSSMIATIN